jgi:hypothetical protein
MDDNQNSHERPCFEKDATRQEDSKLSRREWLIRLGGTSVLMGLQGAPAAGSEPLRAPAEVLPPGLYDPSVDHMTHALESEARFLPAVPGSETDFIRQPSGEFQPQFFSPAEVPLVKRLVALILGESAHGGDMESTITEIVEWIDMVVSQSAAVREAALQVSPQHHALAVAFYGEESVKELETHEPQKIWREGLDWLAAESNHRWNRAFLDAPEASQVELFESLSSRPKTESAGTRIYALLRNQVAHGFYTSQRGLKELDYRGNAFYAESPGCALTKITPQ